MKFKTFFLVFLLGALLIGLSAQEKDSDSILSLIVGKTDEQRYYPRAMAIQTLNPLMSDEDIIEIYKFLRIKQCPKNLEILEFNSLKNDLVCVLLQRNHLPEKLSSELTSMYNDPVYGDTWRDYCLQFLGRCLPLAQAEEAKNISQTLLSAAGDIKNQGLAATALLSLSRNLTSPFVDLEKFKESAYNLAASDDTPAYARLTALQMCVAVKDSRIVPLARELMTNKYKRIQLRMSAMAALGALGDKNDIALLETFRLNSDIRLRYAAIEAIKKLNAK